MGVKQRHYETAAALRNDVDAVFDYWKEHDIKPTITELLIQLGIYSPAQFNAMAKRSSGFAEQVRYAKLRVANWYESNVMEAGKTSGAVHMMNVLGVDRDAMTPVDFEYDRTKPHTEQVKDLLEAMSDGRLPVDTGIKLIKSMGDAVRIELDTEVIERLDALEASLKDAKP